ncbi:MAG: hypothetical protein U9R34_03790 [Nanoarchaeota archaeon]|nr:hypothetical protein [Nanoarchaeota archaeon]
MDEENKVRKTEVSPEEIAAQNAAKKDEINPEIDKSNKGNGKNINNITGIKQIDSMEQSLPAQKKFKEPKPKMKWNYKKIMVIAFLIIIGFCIFLILNSFFGSESISQDEKAQFMLIVNTTDSLSSEYYNCLALVNDNIKFCTHNQTRERCMALYKWDISFLKEESYCDNLIDEQKVICTAFHRKDSSLCSNIDDDAYKNYCFGVVTQDHDYCNLIKDNNQINSDDCKARNKFIYAIKQKDTSLCEKAKIGEFDMVDLCKAMILKDEEYCLTFVI